MRISVLMAAAMVLFGCSPSFGQARLPRNAPTMRMPSPTLTSPTMTYPGMTSPMAAPGAIPAPGTGTLGALQFVPGTPATTSGSTIGGVTTCATTGTAPVVASTPFSASFANPLTGALPPPFSPGATIPPAYSFGTSISTGSCNPAASANTVIEALGTTVDVTIPGLGTTTPSTYIDATVPPTSTQSGAAGMSPQIVVPTPVVPSASPCAGSPPVPLTVVTDPTAFAMTGSTGTATTSSSPLSLFGC
jgi:hypothetical protein